MWASAVYIGMPNELGYTYGERYRIYIFGNHIELNEEGKGRTFYKSCEDFLRNWTNIK